MSYKMCCALFMRDALSVCLIANVTFTESKVPLSIQITL